MRKTKLPEQRPARVHRRRLSGYSRLLVGTSALALLTASADTQARSLLQGASSNSITANAAAGAVLSAQQAAAATQQSIKSLTRATQAVQAVIAAQNAARAAARAAPTAVTDGLSAGGLIGAPRVE